MTLRAKLAAGACLYGLSVLGANAAPLNPNDFASLGLLDGSALTIDTDTLALSGGGIGASAGALFPQGGGPYAEQAGGPPDIAVFVFDANSVLGDVTVTGSNAVAFLFQGNATVSGSINVSATTTSGTSSGGAGGPGGAQGGRGFSGLSNPPPEAGFGPGGGDEGGTTNGSFSGTTAAGGGFGAPGGDGSNNNDGGVAYGDLTQTLEGGSGGGGGGGFQGAFFAGGLGGGGGGGAIEFGALGSLIFSDADILANGGDGKNDPDRGSGGGGSGGGIFLHAFNITIDPGTILSANGGDGSNIGTGRPGGCGGGGRIAVLTNDDGSLINNGALSADPGDGAGGALCDPTTDGVLFATSADIGVPPDPQDPPTGVPAPSGALFFGLGLAGIAAARRRR